MIKPFKPKEVIRDLIAANYFIPNNMRFPLLIYKQTFKFTTETPVQIQAFLKLNLWVNSWVDIIYDYHHYHSNIHETLVIISGECQVQIGGENGRHYHLTKGDVIIIPAGVAHKSINSTRDFKCIGAYPWNKPIDINYGKAEEHPQVDINIEKSGLPECDPIFGKNGLLFDYWK